MRKFNAVLKEKQNILEQRTEEKVLSEFKSVYASLLEQYNISEFFELEENTQDAFLRELHEYWTEETGISDKGKNFLNTKSLLLTESSTENQKQKYLKQKATLVISESLRQIEIKNKLYDILDEMYKDTKAEQIDDVLSADLISKTILESFGSSLENLLTEIVYEISDNNE